MLMLMIILMPIVFWCILGMNSHIFECLNDEEFPVFVLHYVGTIGNSAFPLGLLFQ